MRARTLAFLSVAMWLALVTVGVSRARADVPPPGVCSSPGQPCQNAGTDFHQAGTCVAARCTHSTANVDGGIVMYDCNLCQIPDGGTNGAGGSAAGGTNGAGGSSSASGGTNGGGGASSGCAIAANGSPEAAGSSSLVVALLGLVLGRRRRTSR